MENLQMYSRKGQQVLNKYGENAILEAMERAEIRPISNAFKKFHKIVDDNIKLFGDGFNISRDDDYSQLFIGEKPSELKSVKMPSLIIKNEKFGFRFIPEGKKNIVFTKFWTCGPSHFNERAFMVRKIIDILISLCRKNCLRLVDDGDESYEIYKTIRGIIAMDENGNFEIPKSLLY